MRSRAVAGIERIVIALPPGVAAPPGTTGVTGEPCARTRCASRSPAAGEGDPVLVHDAARPAADPALAGRRSPR